MSSRTFGRDEMNALIGGSANGDGAEEMAAFRQSQPTSRQPASSKGAIKEVDISKMTAAETAKMLSEKARNSASNNSSRYRSQNKVLAHHQLLAEELSKQQTQQAQKLANEASSKKQYDTDDDEDDEFVRERRPVQAAVVVSRRPTENRRRRRRSDSSSSSSSSEESQKRSRRSHRDGRRNRDDSSSSSSSDEEDDRRRNKRVLASRRMQQEPETLVPKLKGEADTRKPEETKRNDSIDYQEEKIKAKPRVERMISRPSKLAQRPGRSASSSDEDEESDSSSSSSSGSSSSSSSESSSEDDEPVRLKPVFVPKHKRNLVQSEERRLEEEDLKLQLDKEQKLKRKAESRAILAKELAAAESSLQNDDDDGQDDEYGGATNAPPNDDDEVDKERERNEWEIREIERLLKSIDELELRKKEEEEYARRKNLTDAECLKEDMESGRYQAPGANRDKRANESGASHNQRFFHRGAFYMDESEWKEGDIREKAADYAATATGEDLIDRSKLPEVMQVKNFGHSRQNTRYKGLAKEDTTDKFAHVLPLQKNQKPSR